VRDFLKKNVVCAIISGIVGPITSLMLEPFIAQMQEARGARVGSPSVVVVVVLQQVPGLPGTTTTTTTATPPRTGTSLLATTTIPKTTTTTKGFATTTVPQSGVVDRRKEYDIIKYIDQDERGSLTFEAFVLTQNFRWKFASMNEVTYPTSQAIRDVPTYLKAHLSYLLKDAQDVISIGMASCEGNGLGEESRAGIRAEMLSVWVHEARPDNRSRNYHIVNLGQYKKHNCRAGKQFTESETSDQRRIVILYVTKKVNIQGKQDLANRILRQLRANDDLLFNPDDYSREFVLTGARVKD